MAEALRKKVVKSNGEISRLMTNYELAGVEVIHDMSTWLASDRPRRRAAIPHSPGVDLTQSTDASNYLEKAFSAMTTRDLMPHRMEGSQWRNVPLIQRRACQTLS